MTFQFVENGFGFDVEENSGTFRIKATIIKTSGYFHTEYLTREKAEEILKHMLYGSGRTFDEEIFRCNFSYEHNPVYIWGNSK